MYEYYNLLCCTKSKDDENDDQVWGKGIQCHLEHLAKTASQCCYWPHSSCYVVLQILVGISSAWHKTGVL